MLIFAEIVFDMTHLIDSEKLIAEIKRRITETEELGELGRANELLMLEIFITSLQQEQPMPDSTQLIEFWHEDKEMLKEKDFRDDAWRLAYNAFMYGFGRGLAVKRDRPEVDLEKEIIRYQREDMDRDTTVGDVARHFYKLGLNARKEG